MARQAKRNVIPADLPRDVRLIQDAPNVILPNGRVQEPIRVARHQRVHFEIGGVVMRAMITADGGLLINCSTGPLFIEPAVSNEIVIKPRYTT